MDRGPTWARNWITRRAITGATITALVEAWQETLATNVQPDQSPDDQSASTGGAPYPSKPIRSAEETIKDQVVRLQEELDRTRAKLAHNDGRSSTKAV
jgi:hypothetical protein